MSLTLAVLGVILCLLATKAGCGVSLASHPADSVPLFGSRRER